MAPAEKDPYSDSEFDVEDESCKTVWQKIEERQRKVPPKKKSGRCQAYPAVISVEKNNDAVATSSSPVEEEEEEEKGRGLNFLQRMKIRDKRQVEAGLLSTVEFRQKFQAVRRRKSVPPQSAKPNPIEETNCSQEMKDFMKVEYEREKKIYSDIPDAQVANSIIHRFKTHKANSGKKIKLSQEEKVVESDKAKESHSGEDSEELIISEFDEEELKPPPAGSFSLSPPSAMVSKTRNLVVRFTTDSESPSMTDKAPSGKELVLKRYSLDLKDLDEPSSTTEVNANTKPRGRSRKKPSRLEECKVVEVEPVKTRGEKRKPDAAEPNPVPCVVLDTQSHANSQADSKGDAKVRKTVTINSQPEFYDVTDEVYHPNENVSVKDRKLKSILKKVSPPKYVLAPSPQTVSSTKQMLTRSQVKVNLLSKFDQLPEKEKVDNTVNSTEEKGKLKRMGRLTNLVTGKLCGNCKGAKEVTDLSLCSVCCTVAYCDVECQTEDWDTHRLACKKFSGLTITEKKDLLLHIFGWDVVEEKEDNSPDQTPEKDEARTPETSPTLVNSIRSQSSGRVHKSRLLTTVGRRPTPHHSEQGRDLDSLLPLGGVQRKLLFAEYDVNDEVVEESQLAVFSNSSEDMFAESPAAEEVEVRVSMDEEANLPGSLMSISDSESKEDSDSVEDRLSALFSDSEEVRESSDDP